MFTTFRYRPFRLLWTASLLMQVGHWFITITFQWVLPHSTDSDGMLLGLLYFCTFTPFLLFSLPSGALADNRDRRSILILSQTIAVALATVCLALSITDLMPPAVVLLLGFISGCIIILVSPANQALTANVVPPRQLANAISLQSVALNLARISGPMLAGPMLWFTGATGAFAVYAAAGVLALVMLSRIRVTRPLIPTTTEGIISRVRAGISHARSRRPTLTVLVAVAFASVFGSGFQAQLPVLGARISSDGDTAFLVLVGATGIGSLIGVILVTRRKRLPSLAAISAGLMGLGAIVVAMGSITSYGLMVAMLVATGILTFWVMTSANILIQAIIDDRQRGRVMSLYFLCWGGLLPFGGLGLGALMSLIGSPAAFAAVGAIAVAGGVGIWVRGSRLPTYGGIDSGAPSTTEPTY